jgi:hypothetical protein
MVTWFTVTVDAEEEWDWASGWPTDNVSVTNIRQLPRFEELCSRHGVAVTYFANSAVFQDAASRETLRELARCPNVEIGMHIHPWNTPPFHHRGPVSARESFLHNLPPDVIHAKLDTVYALFEREGWRPTSFRGGRYSSGPTVQEFLRKKGVRADASVVPYTTWPYDDAPDYRDRGLLPVRLPPRRDEEALWEIPLTLAFTRRPAAFWRSCYERIECSPLRHLGLIAVAEKLGLVRRVWLNFEDPLGEHMLPFLRQLRSMKLPCICFTLHSSSLMAGGNSYTPTKQCEDRLFARIDEVLSTIAGWDDFRPATVTEVATQLEKEHHARTWNQPSR